MPFMRQSLKNMVEPASLQMTIWRMRLKCWIPKAADTQSKYVIFIAFPRQQQLREHAAILRYMYSACIVAL
jgi:hypothetical protein